MADNSAQYDMDSDREEGLESTKIQELEAVIRDQNNIITRLRASRDLHRNKNKEFIVMNHDLEARIRTLTVKEETADLDFDAENQSHFLSKATTSPTPTSSTTSENNKKYPDVPDYYGDKDLWDSWRFHLDAKFRQSAILFSSEHDKMDYIRDHCKSIAFDVIKIRADPLSENPYITSKEMIEELHSMFGDFDKFTKCDAELHDPAFAMGVKRKETFDEFYARFSATIAPLSYNETYKISTLKRLITPKLRLQILDDTRSSFRQTVEHLRRCDQNIRLWAKEDVEEIDEHEFYDAPSTPHTKHPDEYPEVFKDQLKKDGRCLKCLGHGHRPGRCRSTKHLSYEEAKALLVKENAVEKD